MGKLPALQFYPRDWKSDLELQSCSLEARGLWIELMCIMHGGNPYGYLTINGGVAPDKVASKLVGIPLSKYKKLLAELIDAGVASVDDRGAIYSRRMVKDDYLRELRRDAGIKGGNPNLVNQKDNQEVNQGGYPPCTPPSSSSSSSKERKEKEKKELIDEQIKNLGESLSIPSGIKASVEKEHAESGKKWSNT